jgi:hypothetical protein
MDKAARLSAAMTEECWTGVRFYFQISSHQRLFCACLLFLIQRESAFALNSKINDWNVCMYVSLSLSLSLYVCMYVCMYVRTYGRMYVYICNYLVNANAQILKFTWIFFLKIHNYILHYHSHRRGQRPVWKSGAFTTSAPQMTLRTSVSSVSPPPSTANSTEATRTCCCTHTRRLTATRYATTSTSGSALRARRMSMG